MRKIDPAKTQTREENVDAKTQRLGIERIDGVSHCLWAVRTSPSVFHLRMSLCDRHLQRGVGHLKRDELLPVLRPRQPPRGLKPFVKRRRGQGRE